MVAGVADIRPQRIDEVPHLVRPAQHEFISPVGGDTHVCRGHVALRHAVDCGDDAEGGENLVAVLVEPVEIDGKAAAEELGLEAHVVLAGALPGDVRIAEAALDRAGIIGVLPGAVVVAEPIAVLVEFPGIRQIVVAAAGAQLVVTDLAVGCTQFYETDYIILGEPGLEGWHPSCRNCREEAEALALGELLGAVVTHVELCHVAVGVVIGDTPHEAHDAGWHVVTVVWHGVLRCLAQKQGGEVVVSEGSRPVQTGIHIELVPVGIAPGLERTRAYGTAEEVIFQGVVSVALDGVGRQRRGVFHIAVVVVLV